jgi:antitoxin HicB
MKRTPSKTNRVAENPHFGSDFQDFLKEEGIEDEVADLASKIIIAAELDEVRRSKHIAFREMARRMHTSRTEVYRILDPAQDTTISQLERAARALGRRLCVTLR